MDRRRFLKWAGCAAVAGLSGKLGGVAGAASGAEAAETGHKAEGKPGTKRWAMVENSASKPATLSGIVSARISWRMKKIPSVASEW